MKTPIIDIKGITRDFQLGSETVNVLKGIDKQRGICGAYGAVRFWEIDFNEYFRLFRHTNFWKLYFKRKTS